METNRQYDYCIIGTGAAGGILAYRLAKAGLNVISLEQGEDISQSYFADLNPIGHKRFFGIQKKMRFPLNPNDALFIHDLFADADIRSSNEQSESHFKQFQIIALNGLQNLWNGVSVRFAPDDFKNWPIAYPDLEPHYKAIEEKIIVCGTQENISCLPDGVFIPPKPLRRVDKIIMNAVKALKFPDTYVIPNRKAIETRENKANRCISTGICTSGCPVGAVYKFSTRLLPEIKSLQNYQLQLNAKVIRLIRDSTNHSIKYAEVLDTHTSQKYLISAHYFILATGAIESPRILFNSKDDVFQQGLANSNATLGQYLQDNPKVVLSTSLFQLWLSKQQEDIGYGDLLLILSRAQLDDGSYFNFIGHSIYTIPDIPYYLTEFKYIPRFLKPYLVRMMYNSFITLGLFCEGDFIAKNKVYLSDDTDKFGIPQVTIQFQSTPSADEKMNKMLTVGRKILRKAHATIIHQNIDYTGTGIHYAGTCRMHGNSTLGIVDQNLQSYDHSNLYICDGSVIPYLPDKHLTLTIMALADRLSHYLIKKHRSGG